MRMTNLNVQKLPAVSESINNYSITDNFNIQGESIITPDSHGNYPMEIYDDEQFWNTINNGIKNENYCWDRKFLFYYVIVSEWIPRMPGVFWTEKSAALRNLATNEITSRTGRIVTYTPVGKSSKVLGGIGTFKCAPQEKFRMVCLTVSGNASVGIPTLISNDVWKEHGLEEGSVLRNLKVQWVKMSTNWSPKFSSSINLIRGCLILTHSEDLQKEDSLANPVAHPYTILEYYRNGAPYYDFMFFTINKKWDKTKYKTWVDEYKNQENRDGRYIFEPDPNEIIYRADYLSPSHYLSKGQEDINIIESRIEEILKDESSGVFGSIYSFLMTEISNENELVTISKQNIINIPPVQWRGKSSLANTIKSFLDLIINQKKLISLFDLLQSEYPQTFIQTNNQ